MMGVLIKDYEGFIRAFWRRIEPYKNDYGSEFPGDVPTEFCAHFETAALLLKDDKFRQVIEAVQHLGVLCEGFPDVVSKVPPGKHESEMVQVKDLVSQIIKATNTQ